MRTSTASSPSTTSPGSLSQLMREYPLLSFFGMAYAFSWILVIPYILSEWGILHGNFQILFIIKSFGPFLAAYIMIRITEGKEGLLRLRKSIRQARAGWQWYLFILLGIPALIILGIIIQPGMLANFQGLTPTLLVSYAITYILVFFGGGPLGEEPGWRGYALPRMQERHGPLVGTLLLGLLWTCWHLPDFLSPSAQGGGPGTTFATFLTNFSIFLFMVVAMAIVLTWIFNCTRGSVLLAILAHASINTPQLTLIPLFHTANFTVLNLGGLIGFGVPALLILILTHGRLGYHPASEQQIGLGDSKALVSY